MYIDNVGQCCLQMVEFLCPSMKCESCHRRDFMSKRCKVFHRLHRLSFCWTDGEKESVWYWEVLLPTVIKFKKKTASFVQNNENSRRFHSSGWKYKHGSVVWHQTENTGVGTHMLWWKGWAPHRTDATVQDQSETHACVWGGGGGSVCLVLSYSLYYF